MKKKSLLIVILLISSVCQSQQLNIIPKPAEIKFQAGGYSITPKTKIIAAPEQTKLLSYFNDYLLSNYGYKLYASNRITDKGIKFILDKNNLIKRGGYKLSVTKDGITITGNDEGLFRGLTSLLQLFPTEKKMTFSIPLCTITDYPSFAYRGMHLDCGRHFFPVSFIKKYIDFLALYKFNYFHWHLTEDQGWRIEIKKYPKLTEVGAWRNGTIIGRYPGTGNDSAHYGGYYTQDEIKDIVKYAGERYITIIPEIEMPGHSSAAIAAYPFLSCFPNESTYSYYPKQCVWSGDTTGKQVQQTWGVFNDVFCAGKDSTFIFLQDVLDEVMALFPSKYIHVGGDECPKENWKRCPLCQQRMKEEGLHNEHELQSYFIQRIEKYLNSKGRTLIGWDEILEGGLAPNAVVMSWRGEQGGIDAARQNHDVIMTPGGWCYLDHSQSENEDSITIGGYMPVEKVYSYNPVPDSLTIEQGKHILGAQGNVWTEYIGNPEKVEYMVFPRMAALSEVLWTQKNKKDSADFFRRLETEFKRYDLWKVHYSKAYYDLKTSVLPGMDNNGVLWKVESKFPNQKIYYRIADDNKNINSADYFGYISPLFINKTQTCQTTVLNGNAVLTTSVQTFHFNKATGKKITLNKQPSPSYPGNGAFTLVDGVQNEKGLMRRKEFLGFNGADCDALIDLGSFNDITSVTIHAFKQTGSWIWQPLNVEAFSSVDGMYFSSLGITDHYTETKDGNLIYKLSFDPMNTHYVRVVIKNQGPIDPGYPGAGNKAWLFVDEIEVN